MVPDEIRSQLVAADGAGDDGPDEWASEAEAVLQYAVAIDDIEPLDRAIDLLGGAVAAAVRDHPQRAGWCSSLVEALRVRFTRLGDLSDLDRALALGREAVDSTVAADEGRATHRTKAKRSIPWKVTSEPPSY